MPGIIGIIGKDKPVDHNSREFESMVQALNYGGSELVKMVHGAHYMLAVTNIDDGRGGAKYYSTNDGRLECMIDGDVFVNSDVRNFLAQKYGIANSCHAPSYVPYMYQEYGVDLVYRMKGWFNVVLHSKADNSFYIFNSRFGMRPLYYTEVDGYFVFSSSMKAMFRFSALRRRINEKAVFEYALFHYPLGNDTIVQDVQLLDPATVVSIVDSKRMLFTYWRPECLFGKELLPIEESIEGAGSVLRRVVNQMHEDTTSLGVSLTGGFDGRTILSLLEDHPKDLFLYSFGSHDSRDIAVAKRVSKALNYAYVPLYLDDYYADELFDEYARIAITLSDGRASIARAHYPYVFEKLGSRTRTVMTGICGSELLRAFANVGAVISENTRLVYAGGVGAVGRRLHDASSLRYYRTIPARDLVDRLVGSINAIKAFNNSDFTLNQRLYVFLLADVFRKYFGPEIQMESPFLYNRFPFLDYDFVDFIFQTPFCGAYYDFFVQNPFVRIRGQQFYSRIIGKHNKQLAALPTDRSYAPRDLLSPTGKMKVAVRYLLHRTCQRQRDEYGITRGMRRFIDSNMSVFNDSEYVNTKLLLQDFANSRWKHDVVEFSKALSFAYWCKHNIG